MNNKYIYGPVPSRRLGFSLGIDIIPFKNCSFNCIYCQVGRTTNLTIERKEYSPAEEILKAVKDELKKDNYIDYLTFSGSGEPTLNSKIGYLINELKKITTIPVAVLTNGSLLFIPDVRTDLLKADVVLPTLCAATQEIFQKIHRAHSAITIESITDGLIKFRTEYRGKIWLEVVAIKGINDSPDEIKKLNKIIKKINPDKIQLNTVVRPPCEKWALPLSIDELQKIQRVFGKKCEIIADFKPQKGTGYKIDIEKTVYDIVRRRPVTIDDIISVTGIHKIELIKYLDQLIRKKKIKLTEHSGKRYYEHS